MKVYEIKEYLLKEEETLALKSEEFNKLGFELLTTEKVDESQKLILRRDKNLTNFTALKALEKEIDQLENLINEYQILSKKINGLNAVPNIFLKMMKSFAFLGFLTMVGLMIFNYFINNKLLVIVFLISSVLMLLFFLVLFFKKRKSFLFKTEIKEIKAEIESYFTVAGRLEKVVK